MDAHIRADAFRRYKFDLRYSDKSDVAKMIAEVCAHPASDLRLACGLLVSWNRRTDTRNRDAALAILTATPASRARHNHHRSLTLEASLRRATDSLVTRFHRIDPECGM